MIKIISIFGPGFSVGVFSIEMPSYYLEEGASNTHFSLLYLLAPKISFARIEVLMHLTTSLAEAKFVLTYFMY